MHTAARGEERKRLERCNCSALKRVVLTLLATVAAVGVAALPAAAKDGVEATLVTNLPLDAEPGARIRVGWTLTYAEGEERGRPFGANGVFVRLVSAAGAQAETGFAPTGSYATGRYAATVTVPEGGIADVRIGLRGWTSGARGTRRSDLLFPIANDPVPASARVGAPPSRDARVEPPGVGPNRRVFGVALAALLGACVLVAFARRRHRGERAQPS